MTDHVVRPLTGRVALVTGAGQGNGRAIALRLAADGAMIAVNDLDADAAQRTADTITEAEGKAIAAPGDVSQLAAVQAMVARTVDELGGLDILVNNAGLIRPNPFGSVTEEDWDITLDVNARGLFFCSQEAARVMGGGATIINISSTAGRGVATLSPPYAASKAAVISLTQQTARSLAPAGIRVNAVCPGIIDTDFNHRLDRLLGVEQQGLPPGEFLRQRAQTPLMKRLGTAEEVASVVAFLAGPDASYVNGQSINVDGGIYFS
jgi:meso-butanediol dehydrogenase / (S,S)-butanediol dehydrogenase / diacetyl reductase